MQPKTVVILCAIVAALFLAAAAAALEKAIDIPTTHLDGAYQTASGLFRLHAGHFPGRDFFPYLGVGVLYTLYPFFAAAGADLAASVFAAYLAIWVAGALAVTLVWHLVWRGSSFLVSLVCGAFLTYVLGILTFNPDVLAFKFVSLSVNEFVLLYAASFLLTVAMTRLLWPAAGMRRCLMVGSVFFVCVSAYYVMSLAQAGTFLLLFLGVLWFRFVWPPSWIWRSLAAAIAMTLLLVTVADMARDNSVMRWALSPGASLRPLRAWLPYFAAFWMFVILGTSRSSWRTYLWAGALSGSLTLWSNDFAWSTSLLVTALFLVGAYRARELGIANAVLYAMAGLITAGALFFAACGGYPERMFAYNFLDVAQDQWWYFAMWEERYRIFSLQDLAKLILPRNVLAAAILVAVAAYAIRQRSLAVTLLLWVGLALAAGGVVASVGGYLGRYFDGLYFWAYVVVVVTFLRLFWVGSWRFSSRGPLPHELAGFAVHVPGALLVLSLAVFGKSYVGLHAARESAAASVDRFYVAELGGYLKSAWVPYVETARKLSNSVVFEEYWGVLSAIQRRTPDWPVDSVIHALGSKRELLASKVFSQADTIVTTRSSYSSIWQPWLVSENYWFYSPLFHEFEVVGMGPHTVIWRRGARQVFEPMDCQPAEQGAGIVINVTKLGYAEIEVAYRADAEPKRKLVMLRNNINNVGGMRGYFSIDPSKMTLVFPAFFKETGPQALDFRVVPKRSTALVHVAACQARRIGRAIPEVLDGIPKAMEECKVKPESPIAEPFWPWESREPSQKTGSTESCDGQAR